MALNDFFTYKSTYSNSSLSDNKQKYFMKAVINALEVIIHKQVDLEKEVKRLKSEIEIIKRK